jgi:hypothetical protein
MDNIQAIQAYFGKAGGGAPVTMQEMKQLTPTDRAELGAACCLALGEPYTPITKVTPITTAETSGPTIMVVPSPLDTLN